MVQNHPPIEADVGLHLPFVNRGIVEIAWSRKWLVALGIVGFLALGLLYYIWVTPVYQSRGQVLVAKSRPDSVTGIDTRSLTNEDYVATHKAIIESSLILNLAIKKGNLDSFESFAGVEDMLDAVSKNLTVSRNKSTGASTSSSVLDLSFRAVKAHEAPKVLNAIIDTFREFLNATYHSSSDDTLERVKNERVALEQDLKKKQGQHTAFLKTAPYMGRNKDGSSLSQESLSKYRSKRSALLLKKVELQGYLEAIDTNVNNKASRESMLAMMAGWISRPETEGTKNAPPVSYERLLAELLQKEADLVVTKGSNTPEVQGIREQIKIIREFLANPFAPYQPAGPEAGKSKPTAPGPSDPIKTYRTYFQDRLNHVEAEEKLVEALYRAEEESARNLTYFQTVDENFKTDIARGEKMLDVIIQRLQDVKVAKNVGGYEATTITEPSVAKKVSPRGTMVFAVFTVIGALVGLGLAYLAEVKDNSFHSMDEIRKLLDLPLVGHVPHLRPVAKKHQLLPSAGAVPDPMLCTFYRPNAIEAESFRGVRTALFFHLGEGLKIIQVASANRGDGKTTLAGNLAVTIAQSGKRVLLIDADLRNPKVHKLFALSNKVGLVSVLAEQMELPDAIQDTGVAGLSILPCGPSPLNPAELLNSPTFKEFLESVREKYDFVLLDTSPLLAVTDPSVVASRVDGVLLTVRLTKNARRQAVRAKEILSTLGANVLGVIVNETHELSGSDYGYGYTEAYHEDVRDMVEENGNGTLAGRPDGSRGKDPLSSPGRTG